MGERPPTIVPARVGRPLIAGRRSGAALVLAVALVAGLAACSGSSGPAALSVRCTGPALTGPDTTAVSQNDVLQPATPAAVTDVPRPVQAGPATGSASILDPANPGVGYATRGWDVTGVAAIGGPTQWTATIRPPGPAQPSDRADLSLQAYTGYLIVTGGRQGQYLAAVSDQGKAGPVCTLPPYDATDGVVALLPHAGVLVAANPAAGAATTAKDTWLNGYSTATGQRLWSVDTHSSANDSADLVISGDTAYIFQEYTGKIAAYDARTGHQSWLADSGTAALLGGDNRLLGAGDGRVYAEAGEDSSSRVEALNGTTGRLLWKRDLPEAAGNNQISLSQAGTGLVAVAGSGRRDYLLDAADGSVVSSLPVQLKAGLPQPCTVYGNPAVAVIENGAIGVLSSDRADNKTIRIAPGPHVATAIASTVAYVRAQQPGAPIDGYDLATGRVRWSVRQPGTQAYDNLDAFDGGFVLYDTSDRAFR